MTKSNKNNCTKYDHFKQEKDDFIYAVTHDLTAPLRHIKGFLDIIFDDLRPHLNEDHEKYKEIIYNATDGAYQKLDGLLQLSRLAPTKENPEKVNIQNFLKKKLENCKQNSDRDFITNFSFEDKTQAILIHKDMLEILINEVISNSIHHAVTKNILEINISTKSSEKALLITIADNGTDAKGNEINQIKRPFFTTKKEHSFSGLGGCKIDKITSIINTDWTTEITKSGGLKHVFTISI